MDDKEFRKLRREDLVEIIYQYQRREQRLIQENQMLRSQLEDRQIRVEKAGSIAEAALALSGIFETAQKAADFYLQSVRNMSEGKEKKMPVQEESASVKSDFPQEKTEKTGNMEKAKEAAKQEKNAQTVQDEKKQKVSDPLKQKSPLEERKMSSWSGESPKPEKPGSQEESDGKQITAAKELPIETPAPAGDLTDHAEHKKSAEPPKQNTSDEDTDEFIKSLKGILGRKKPEGKQTASSERSQKEKASAAPAAKPAAKTEHKISGQQEKNSAASGDTDEFIASLKEYLGM